MPSRCRESTHVTREKVQPLAWGFLHLGLPPKACTAGQQGGPQLGDVCANPQQWKQLDSRADVSRVGCHSCWGFFFPVTFQSHILPLKSILLQPPIPSFSHQLSPLPQMRSRVWEKGQDSALGVWRPGPATVLLCDL